MMIKYNNQVIIFVLLICTTLNIAYYHYKSYSTNSYYNRNLNSFKFNYQTTTKMNLNENNEDPIKLELTHSRWSSMWENGIQPGEAFDAYVTSPLLIKYLHDNKIPNGRALVPGCGRGYDVTILANKDRYVLGLDIAEQAIVAAKNRLNSLTSEECVDKTKVEFSTKSFFDLSSEYDKQFDFIYDYTFLCALHPSVRTIWATKMAEMIKPGGLLLTLIFPIRPIDDKGPPYALLVPNGFECLQLELLPSELCHEGRDGTSPKYNAYSGVGMFIKN